MSRKEYAVVLAYMGSNYWRTVYVRAESAQAAIESAEDLHCEVGTGMYAISARPCTELEQIKIDRGLLK